MSEIDTTRAMAKRASSILMQHYHGQLNNPIIMARMLLLEGVFDEQDCYEVTRETANSGQNDTFHKALEQAVDDYDKLIIFAVILLKYKTTVHIGKIVLKECGKPFDKLETVHPEVQEVSLACEDKFEDQKREFLQLFIEMKKEIEKKHIPMDKLRSFLSFSFLELADQLETAESIEELLTIISIHTSVLNVLHLKDIACHYTLETVIQQLQVYNVTLEEMGSEMLVKELYEQTLMPNSNRPLLQSECVEFTLNSNVGEESLCYVQRMLTIAFCRMAHHIMVKMVSANGDKLYLLCYAPLHLCGELMSLATKNKDELVKHRVVGVSIAGCVVISREELLVKENSKQLLECEDIDSTTGNNEIQSESELRRENAILWPKLEWYRMIEAKELELRRLTDEYSKYKQSCELIQSEIIKLQQVESSVTLQLQMNEQAISHLNEQIEKKHQKVLDNSKKGEEQEKLDKELYSAVEYNNNISDVEKLLKNNANPNSHHSFYENTSLHCAVKKGNIEILNLLISYGGDVHLRDRYGNTPLYDASKNGNVDVVNILLAHGGAVHTVNKNKQTPLHYASQSGNADTVSVLISHGGDIHAVDEDKLTPLHLASMNGKADVVNILITHGGYVHAVDVDRDTPLNIAKGNEVIEALKKQQMKDKAVIEALSKNNHEDIEKSFMDGGNKKLQNLDEALYVAVIMNYVDVIEGLLKNGANSNICDDDKWTPLHLASMKGKADVVNILISHGGYVHAVDVNGETPLDKAKGDEVIEALNKQQMKDKAVIEALSKNNQEDIEKSIKNGGNKKLHNLDEALYVAVIMNYVDVIEGLLKNGANSNICDDNKTTPLHWASGRGDIETVTTLLAHGGNVEAQDKYKLTPLHWASSNGHSEVVKLLLSQYARVNAKDWDDSTPLHKASGHGHTDVVKTLISHGSDIHAKDKDDRTPLHKASGHGHTDVVKTLISHRADIHAKDKYGISPLDMARLFQHDYNTQGVIGILKAHENKPDAQTK